MPKSKPISIFRDDDTPAQRAEQILAIAKALEDPKKYRGGFTFTLDGRCFVARVKRGKLVTVEVCGEVA